MKALHTSSQKPTARSKRLSHDIARRRLSLWCWGFALALLAGLGSVRSAQAEVEIGKYKADIFVPNSLFFTGQKTTTLNNDHWLAVLGRGLDNRALEQVANNVRINNMSSAQRVLNYQWLGQQHNNDIECDGSAVSALLKLGLRTLWDQYRATSTIAQRVLPDSGGRGTFNLKQHDLDYKLKISNGELGITFNYDF